MSASRERLILGIDTTGAVGSVAVWSASDPEFRFEESFGEGLIHGVALAPRTEAVLRAAGATVRDLELVAVGLGPGSYTGVRVGTTFAKSLAHAAGIPVVGVPSLLALAAGAPAEPGETVVCVRDARRGTLYFAAYRVTTGAPESLLPLRLVSLDELPGVLPAECLVTGDALDRFSGVLSGDRRTLLAREHWEVSAAAVARIGEAEVRARGPDPTHDLAPLYLRLSEAEERFGASGEPA